MTILENDAKRGVIEHMNEDHADACLMYAQHFAGIALAERAVMTDVSLEAMELEVDGAPVTIPFHRQAEGRDDLRAVLVEMVKIARRGVARR
ncbi:MAG: DUF2470 domain-containing protein [Pseudomonadota bacterium]